MNIKEDIINRLSIFKNFYDEIRIVEPFEGSVDIVTGDKSARNCDKCFVALGKTAPCTNCISSRAYYSDDTVIKYDYKNGKPISMISSPIDIDGKKYIVEIIKYITRDELVSIGLTEQNALEKISELNYQVAHDGLTDVYNRRYIDDRLQQSITAALKSRKNLSIIMCDIDFFKKINDKYGHQCGDEMLKHFASIIDKISQKYSGWTGRYGGEEFISMIPDKTLSEVHKIAEKMRAEFENSSITFNGEQIKATASFGIASLPLDEKMHAHDLITIADKKLYDAKENGRNTVVI